MNQPVRVLSLLASSTEIVHALGCGELLVGRSHECDFPPEVLKLPSCTEPKFIVDGSSVQIDERVKGALEAALSVYQVFPEKLKAVKPDVIITQTQCEVCAVSMKDVEAALQQCVGMQPEIVALCPNSLADIWEDIRRIAKSLKVVERGEALIASLKQRMENVSSAAGRLQTKPRVACIEWIEPLMAAGNWMPELVAMAGAVNIFGEAGKHSPWMEWAALRDSDPDVILVLPCGFSIARTLEEVHRLAILDGWSELRAVQNRKVFVVDGNQFANRPGPRVVETLEILAEILHPGSFLCQHHGSGWVELPSA